MNPEDRVVILTGASQGIGRSAAYLLAQAGCKLALAARRSQMLEALAAELSDVGGQVLAVPTDIGDTAQARALVRQTVAAFGRIDVVINNAAVIQRLI